MQQGNQNQYSSSNSDQNYQKVSPEYTQPYITTAVPVIQPNSHGGYTQYGAGGQNVIYPEQQSQNYGNYQNYQGGPAGNAQNYNYGGGNYNVNPSGGAQYYNPYEAKVSGQNYVSGVPVVQEMSQNAMNYQNYPQTQLEYGNAVVNSATVAQNYGEFGFMGTSNHFLIKQRFEALEALANTLGMDCVEQANKYDIFDLETGMPVLHVKEKSDMFMRCCCKPNHTAKLLVYDVRGNEAFKNQITEINHFQQAYGKFNRNVSQINQKYGKVLTDDMIVMTISKPFKCNMCACHDFCLHEAKSRLGFNRKDRTFGVTKKVFPCGGWFTPTLEIKDQNDHVFGKVVGPFFIVAGLIELMSHIKFTIFASTDTEINNDKVLAVIEKRKPEGANKLQEMVGDADQFILDIKDSSMSAEKKANLIGTMLLLDYMFFEGGPPVEYNPIDGSCKINCWTCYCCGCVCPCETTCGGNQGGAS